jgi:hypothetical protein
MKPNFLAYLVLLVIMPNAFFCGGGSRTVAVGGAGGGANPRINIGNNPVSNNGNRNNLNNKSNSTSGASVVSKPENTNNLSLNLNNQLSNNSASNANNDSVNTNESNTSSNSQNRNGLSNYAPQRTNVGFRNDNAGSSTLQNSFVPRIFNGNSNSFFNAGNLRRNNFFRRNDYNRNDIGQYNDRRTVNNMDGAVIIQNNFNDGDGDYYGNGNGCRSNRCSGYYD